jgi:hypothetical protein
VHVAHYGRPTITITMNGLPPSPPQSPLLARQPHTIINSKADVQGGGVEDGIVGLAPNGTFTMGAPPGVLGAIETMMMLQPQDTAMRCIGRNSSRGNVGLPCGGQDRDDAQDTPVRLNAPVPHTLLLHVTTEIVPPPYHHHHHHHHHESECPHCNEDVLSVRQLLTYLSKYPHAHQVFYQPRTSFHPATAMLRSQQPAAPTAGPSSCGKDAMMLSMDFSRLSWAKVGRQR